jgi:hypothetical protein
VSPETKTTVVGKKGHGAEHFHWNESVGSADPFPGEKMQSISFSGRYCKMSVQKKHRRQVKS